MDSLAGRESMDGIHGKYTAGSPKMRKETNVARTVLTVYRECDIIIKIFRRSEWLPQPKENYHEPNTPRSPSQGAFGEDDP
jgi:hypothetical protein